MIKVKDGYAKLIGTTYQGSATQVLLSNGGDLEYSASSKASTLVQRNASLHIYATYFNSAISDEALTDIGSVYVRNTSDTFIRRVSKTLFYSILDDKFVTLDTTQSITGAKTFSTSVRFANNASIILNLNDTSNYTIILKWYKNGASRNTYDPSIGQHNTGGDGNGSICILPYPTETSPLGGTVGLFISKGVLKLDGKSVALAENYYTKTESDERYVNVTGDTMTGPLIVKAAITGTQLISTIATGTSPLKVTSTTVVTNLNSDLLDGLHETSFFRARGDLSIASSVPTTTELATSNNLCGSWNVKYTGASGHLVLFNAGSGSTRYMQFYSMYSGSLYWRNSTDSTLNTKSWKTIVDSANYTGIVLKIGTATKGSATLPIYLNAGTPTACSTTLGVSITGNAATATKLLTARTINGTSFDGTANIVTAYWGTARTISLSGAVTGSASVNGSLNVTITTTYLFGSIDGRYVGGNKTANHGSSGTAYTADTYSSTFVNKAFVAFAERGSWAYANNGYVSTDTGVNIPLAGTAIFLWGASDTNKTLLYITPHNNSGVSNPAANEMLFYTSNGSGYTSAWTRVLTHRNYTNYTVTKTGGGASGTWGISITGNAASARKLYKIDGTSRTWSTSESVVGNGIVAYTDTTTSGRWDSYGSLFLFSNADNPTPGTNGHWLTQLWSGTSNKLGVRWRTTTGGWTTMLTILTNTNYISYADTRYVTALGTSGNYLTWTKNGTTNNITIPYATTSAYLTNGFSAAFVNKWDCNAPDRVVYSDYGTPGRSVTNAPSGWNYGTLLELGHINYRGLNGTLNILLMWDVAHNTTSPGTLWFRGKDSVKGWAKSWAKVITDLNISSILSNYYTKSESDGKYVTLATTLTISGSKTFTTGIKFSVNNNGDANLGAGDGFKLFYNHTSGSNFPGSYYNVASFMTGYTGFQLACYGGADLVLKYRHRLDNGTWYPWLTLAFTSQLKDPADYYWANIKVSASSSTATLPTFNTCYTSNWFRSSGATGWFNQSYSGGVYMNENYWVKTYGGTMMYIAPDAHAWGIGGHNIAMKLYHSSHIGINFATSAYTWGIYANSNGNMYIGRRTGNVNDSSGTYYHTLTASYISSPGFYHSAIGSNSYVLLAGGSYKGLGDFAKGNAGSATKGVYVTGGTVTAMTYSLSSNLNSGTSGKLAYYSSATTVAAYTSSVGATNRGVYMNAGVPTVMTYYLNATVNSGTSGKLAYYSSTNALSSYTTTVGSTHLPVYMSSGVPTICGYSFKGSSRLPIVLLSGVFYRSGTTWYMDSVRTHKVVDATPSITISGARMLITLPGTTISSGVVTLEQTTDFSASSTVDVNSHGNGAYGFAVYSNVGNYVYVRTWCQRNDKNHSWASNGEPWTTFLMRIQVTLFGYIN